MQITVPKVGNGTRPPLDGSSQSDWPDNTGPIRAKTTYENYGIVESFETEYIIEVREAAP